MKIPKINTNDILPSHNFSSKGKCKTCAYHKKSTTDEDQMTIDYFMEHPLPHQCHEVRYGFACYGSMIALERLTEWRRP